MNRLSTSNENGGASWTQTNGYDRYGNRWIDLGGGNQSIYVSTSTNRITNSGFTYDSSGNLTNDTVHAYTFDAEGHVKTVDSTTAYVYDGSGARVRKLVGENTRFVYGLGGELIMEFNGATGNLMKEYVYGGASMATIEPTALNGNGTRYSTADNLGSPRVITNSNAGVVSRHDYMPFGEELGVGVGGRTSGMGFSVADGNRKKFTGYEADAETGLNFAEARYQSSTQGRFTSPDPFGGSMTTGDPQSFNRYAYVANNPLIYTDPSGMAAERGGPVLPGATGALGRVHPGDGSISGTDGSNGQHWTMAGGCGHDHTQSEPEVEPQVAAVGALVRGLAEVTVPQQPSTYTGLQIPTSATITIGDPHMVTSEEKLNANGLVYMSGIEADYQITVFNQFGEVMGPNSGIMAKESIEVIEGGPSSPLTQPSAVAPDANGVFHDGFGPIYTTYAPITRGNAEGIVLAMFKTPQSLTIRQTLTLSVHGVEFATATSIRSYSNVDAKGNLLPYTSPGGGFVNNYRFNTSAVEITRLTGHMIF